MPASLSRSLLAAAVLSAAVPLAALGVPTGNISGQVELPFISTLKSALDLQNQAQELANANPGDVPELTRASIDLLLDEADAQMASAQAGIEAALTLGAEFQDRDLALKATKALDIAIRNNAVAHKDIDRNKVGALVGSFIDSGADNLVCAIQNLGGTGATVRDRNANRDNGLYGNGDPCSFVADADIAATKAALKKAEAVGGKGKVKKVKKPKYEGLTVAGLPAFRPGPDNYYAFEGTGSTPGYAFKTFGRQLFGPFETRFQVGSFKLGDTVDTGSACIEFDVEGSSPLQFVAVCGRRVDGGVQVFVQSHDGPAGSLFLPSTSIATVLVTYSGTQFLVKAASGKFAPDFVLNTVGTVNLTQGETALVAGLGASGLTKGAEVGLDEIFITAQ